MSLRIRRPVTDTPDDLAITAKSDNVHPDVGVVERSPVPLPTNPSRCNNYARDGTPIFRRNSGCRGTPALTLIEVLSPANKRGAGYREYVEKRTRILLSASHLLEIDLLVG